MRTSIALLALALLLPACADEHVGFYGKQSERRLSTDRVWTRMHTDAPGKLRRLLAREGVDVTGSHHRLGFVDILTSPAERDRLVQKYAPRIERAAALDLRRAARALADYHDPAEMSAFLDQVEADYPSIARKVTLQTGLPEGGVIHAMRISDNAAVDEDEPTFLMDGQTHGREVMTAEVMMDAIDHLTSSYGLDPAVTRWVDQMEIWIVPVVNPDGADYVHTSASWWRKNRSHECGSGLNVGVDLNRNFEWNYRQCSGSSDVCWDETYHGPGPASEIETQTVQALMAELRPMYYINYHSSGEYIVWSSACGLTEEQEMLSQVGSDLNDRVQTDSGQTGQWTIGNTSEVMYEAPGGADDHGYGGAGAVSFTIELNSTDFQPDYATWRDITCQRQRAAWGHLLDRTLDYPAVVGHTFDADTLQPVEAAYFFANHPFSSGQWQLATDHHGRYGRVVLPDSEHVIVFTAPGYLPETRIVAVGSGPTPTEVPMRAGENHPPTIDAGQNQTVSEGDTVVLDASGSSDPDGNTLFFTWTRIEGPNVFLQDAWSASPTFFAPSVDADAQVVFEVTASDGELESPAASVTVFILDVWNETVVWDSTDTPIQIPDDDPLGIFSVIHIAEDRAILKAVAHVDITHTWIGDLYVSLTSPSGTQVVLHDHEGDSADDIHADYEIAEFAGEMSGGDWTLFVLDSAGADDGSLDHWSLSLDLVGGAACDSPADCDLPNVDQHTCTGGRCEIFSCDPGFRDCDAAAGNGCEIDVLGDPANCGVCDLACQYQHAAALCNQGACEMGPCDTGYTDCNEQTADGCEIRTADDPENCGGCGTSCVLPNATAGCQEGLCVVAQCDALRDDCDLQAENGCETDVSADTANCGACDNACEPAHAFAACIQGDCVLDGCQGTWADCDGQAENGCEHDLDSDVNHCGSCDFDCHSLNAQVACQAGACVVGDCLDGYGNCNSDTGDGCEAELSSDHDHCGACGMSCDLPNALAGCLAGQCLIESCSAWFGNCNRQTEDGCEVDLESDPDHCGSCGIACDLPHASSGCEVGECTVAECEVAFGDCNADPEDGCETYLNNNDEHCGGCGIACDLPDAASACRQGECTLTGCEAGFGNCDRDSENGCEARFSSDPANCGGCGNECEFPNAGGVCEVGQCLMGDCADGFGDCNGDPEDGCERELASDDAHCGACDNACASDEVCIDGRCDHACQDADGDGFADALCGGGDCDDADPAVGPDGSEVCNGVDDDCDGLTDEDLDCDDGGCGCAGSSGLRGSPFSVLAWIGLLGLAVRPRLRRRR